MWVTIEMVSTFTPSMTPVGFLILVIRDPVVEFGEQGAAGVAIFCLEAGCASGNKAYHPVLMCAQYWTFSFYY